MGWHITQGCESWLWANGLNDDTYVIETLQNVPHQDIADEVLIWMEAPEDERGAILEELAKIQARLNQKSN